MVYNLRLFKELESSRPGILNRIAVGDRLWVDPVEDDRFASLAQLAEHLTLNQRVEGSSPSGGTRDLLRRQALTLVAFFIEEAFEATVI